MRALGHICNNSIKRQIIWQNTNKTSSERAGWFTFYLFKSLLIIIIIIIIIYFQKLPDNNIRGVFGLSSGKLIIKIRKFIGSYLSKETLKGRFAQEKLLEHTPYISKFRFSWFQPVWLYSPTLSFPKDRMEPGFFLKLADNTGDGFAYEILPVKNYENIPLRRNPTVLVRCVVREREYGNNKSPTYREKNNELTVYNSDGKEVTTP